MKATLTFTWFIQLGERLLANFAKVILPVPKQMLAHTMSK
jgi:hypothetical protein